MDTAGELPTLYGTRSRALKYTILVLLLLVDLLSAAGATHPITTAGIVLTLWLVSLGAVLTLVRVRVPSGFLSLSGIASCTAALTLTPSGAMLTGLSIGLAHTAFISRSTVLSRPWQLVVTASWSALPSWGGTWLTHYHAPAEARLAAVIATWVAANWILTATLGGLVLGASPIALVRRNLNWPWVAAFAYMAASAIVVTNLLDGTRRGYFLATLTASLSLALADAIAGRQLSKALIVQLNDAERYLTYSRVVEGIIHNVRNSLAVSLGYLDELRSQSQAASARRADANIGHVQAAVLDAVEGLNRLQLGSNPSLQWSPAVDLRELASAILALTQEVAAQKRVRMSVKPGDSPIVPADSGLLRQVVTNLVLNAIDAAPTGGWVRVELGWRPPYAFLSVTDNGHGVADEHRGRLFEPHFTTKPDGNGIGLFISYGIARQHGGDLLYEGSGSGAVFTILLLPVPPESPLQGPLSGQA